jgi:hypothetical protein
MFPCCLRVLKVLSSGKFEVKNPALSWFGSGAKKLESTFCFNQNKRDIECKKKNMTYGS